MYKGKLRALALVVKRDYKNGYYYIKAYDVEEKRVYKVFKRKRSYLMNSEIKAETSVISALRKQGHWIDFRNLAYNDI